MTATGRHWTPELRDEVRRRLLTPGASASQVARDMGLRQCTVMKYARMLREDQFASYLGIHGGYEPSVPGTQFSPPPGHIVKGVSALVNDKGETLQTWVKTREGSYDPLALAELLQEAMEAYEPRVGLLPGPDQPAEELLSLIPLADFHLGMFAWGQEADENWDLKIAEASIVRGIEQVIGASPSCAEAVVLGGGDLIHSDNMANRTAQSGHALDVDGRWPKVLHTACRLMVRVIDAALQRHGRVTVRMLRGNHDDHSAVAVSYFLLAWYRNEPRITVDADPSLFWWFRWGKTLLGATHGHTVKLDAMPQIMAHRRAEDWGATKFRYVHGFHIHHKKLLGTEGGGVYAETHQTPTPQDAWHYGAGYLAGRSLKVITYHKDGGEVARITQAIL